MYGVVLLAHLAAKHITCFQGEAVYLRWVLPIIRSRFVDLGEFTDNLLELPNFLEAGTENANYCYMISCAHVLHVCFVLHACYGPCKYRTIDDTC